MKDFNAGAYDQLLNQLISDIQQRARELQEERDEILAERDQLLLAAKFAKTWVDEVGAHSPVMFGGEAEVSERLRLAIRRVDPHWSNIDPVYGDVARIPETREESR